MKRKIDPYKPVPREMYKQYCGYKPSISLYNCAEIKRACDAFLISRGLDPNADPNTIYKPRNKPE